MPLISVVVPFRNARAYLRRCIKSLLEQTLSHDAYEIIFIDNNSDDDGRAIVADYSRVRLLDEPTNGSYAARNRGLVESKGEIIAFTDSDCEVDRDWLERISNEMHTSDVSVILGQRVAATDGGVLSLISAYESQKASYVTARGFDALFFGHTNNMAVRRRIFDLLGPFPEILRGGDTVMISRMIKAYGSGAARYCPEIRVRHLEVVNLRSYYSKHRIYGASNEYVRALAPYRPLTNRERWQVFRQTVREKQLSPAQGSILLAVLIPGVLCYEWSRRMARRRI